MVPPEGAELDEGRSGRAGCIRERRFERLFSQSLGATQARSQASTTTSLSYHHSLRCRS